MASYRVTMNQTSEVVLRIQAVSAKQAREIALYEPSLTTMLSTRDGQDGTYWTVKSRDVIKMEEETVTAVVDS